MEKTRIVLPKRKRRQETHRFYLHIPLPLWERLIVEGGVERGTTTQFVLEAITEKLNRRKE